MRTYLFLLLAVVTAVLLWAIRNESYQNGLVFSLGLLCTGLCGYLLAEYFLSNEKKTLAADLTARRKEIDALKEQTDLLQTQVKIATPHAQVDQLEQRLALVDDEKTKLDGISRQQTAEIAHLKAQIASILTQKEEADISSETRNSEVLALQDSLKSTKERLQQLTNDNAWLRGEIARIQGESDGTFMPKAAVQDNDTEGVIGQIIEEDVEVSTKDIELEITDNQQVIAETLGEPDVVPTFDATTTVAETIDDNTAEVASESATIVAETLGEPDVDTVVETPQFSKISDPEWEIAAADSRDILAETIGESDFTEGDAEATSDDHHNPISEIEKHSEIEPIKKVYVKKLGATDFVEVAADNVSDATDSRSIEDKPAGTALFTERHPIYGGTDNLRAIEGIGPKVELLLKENGIQNWGELAAAPTEYLSDLLTNAGPRYSLIDPTTWTHQASLLSEGKFDELQEYVRFMKSNA
jgi:predicted flap endonuclease-1-like 5' DNA nuclease